MYLCKCKIRSLNYSKKEKTKKKLLTILALALSLDVGKIRLNKLDDILRLPTKSALSANCKRDKCIFHDIYSNSLLVNTVSLSKTPNKVLCKWNAALVYWPSTSIGPDATPSTSTCYLSLHCTI